MTKKHEILAVLENTFTSTPISWSDIMVEIEKEVKIKNWMVVRSIIQYMLDEKIIMRVSDLHKELYRLM